MSTMKNKMAYKHLIDKTHKQNKDDDLFFNQQ